MENKVDKKPTAATTTKTSQPHAQKTFEMLNVEMEPRLHLRTCSWHLNLLTKVNVVNGQGEGVARGRRKTTNCEVLLKSGSCRKASAGGKTWRIMRQQRRQTALSVLFLSPSLSLSTSCGHCPPGKNMLPTHRCHGKCKRRQQRRAKAKAKAEPKANVRISPSSEFAVYNFITFKLNAFSCRFSCPGGLNGPPLSCSLCPPGCLVWQTNSSHK